MIVSGKGTIPSFDEANKVQGTKLTTDGLVDVVVLLTLRGDGGIYMRRTRMAVGTKA